MTQANRGLKFSCPWCENGLVDSGGTTPWGEWINVTCGYCDGRAEVSLSKLLKDNMMPEQTNDHYANVFNEAVEKVIADVEERTGKPMKESQKMGLYNSGSFMFLEAMADRFYYADTDEKLQQWLQEIDGFNRSGPSQ